MTIVDLLKSGNARVSFGFRWLYWDEETKMWVVREHKPYQKSTSVICATTEEELAVQVLTED